MRKNLVGAEFDKSSGQTYNEGNEGGNLLDRGQSCVRKGKKTMDIKIQAKEAEHIYRLISKKPFDPVVPFLPVKERFDPEKKSTRLPRKLPESVGVSSSMLSNFLKELEKGKKMNVHQVMVVKDGAVISEGAMAPFRMDFWHVSHSMCKTVTAMAIGILISDGKLSLEDKLVKILEKHCSPLSRMRLGKITVRHLLTMSSGLIINEGVIAAESDWLKACMESGCSFEPGSKFAYNSMNSYLLSCIVQEITGITLFDFLSEKLFRHMGIRTICWESCPMGRTKGGWGMYILPEDMAKLGLFLLQKGTWQGKRLIAEEFIEEMTAKQMETPEEEGGYGYGYHVWMGKRPGSFLFNGMLGQNIHCMPDIGVVVVVTGGNEQLFGNCQVNEVIYRYFADHFSPKGILPENRQAVSSLRSTERHLKSAAYWFPKDVRSNRFLNLLGRGDRLPKEAVFLSGRSYEMEKSFVRFLPMFAQLLNNSYTQGISRIGFEIANERLVLILTEGEEIYKIAVGFQSFEYSSVTIHEENYLVAAMGMFTYDEDSNPVLKISMPFLEHSNGRLLKIHFLENGRVKLRWLELPGKEVITGGAEAMLAGMSDMVVNQIRSKFDLDLIFELIDSVMEPVVMGHAVNERKRS